MRKRFVITGAGGFLGYELLEYLCREKICQSIIAITLGADELKKRLEYFTDHSIIEVYEAEAITNGEITLDRDDIILNCAYPRAMKGTDITEGIDYIESVFQNAAASGVRGIVNVSSQSVYNPNRDHPATEDDSPFLYDGYSIGKYCIEVLLRNVCRNIPHTNVRLASMIGPGFNIRVPNKMVEHALTTGEIHVEVNQREFSYLDVEDAARGLIRIASSDPEGWHEVYNMGADETYTLIDIADVIKRKLMEMNNISVEIIKHESEAVSNSALCNNKVKSLIGQYSLIPLEQSIEKIIMSYVDIKT